MRASGGMSVVAGLLAAGPVAALSLADCTRTTHVSHGGEAGHRDLGEGRVMWGAWWSQEGVFEDLYLANCETGQVLRARTREERVSARPPFDRTDKALGIVETLHTGAAPFFTLERVTDALDGVGRDIEIAAMTAETCGCAAAYPDARGDREPFEMDQ